MADLVTIREQVRRMVNDHANQLFSDDHYDDAVGHALDVMNFDFDKSWDIATVPANRVFLLKLQAAAYMADMRATEAQADGHVGSINVPNLSVSEQDTSGAWKTLADGWRAQYEAKLKSLGGSEAGGETDVGIQGVIVRVSRRNGRITDRRFAQPLQHDLGASASAIGTMLTISWEPIRGHKAAHFARYEILWGTDPAMASYQSVQVYDNHEDTLVTDVGTTGTFYCRVDMVSEDAIRTKGDVMSVVVS